MKFQQPLNIAENIYARGLILNIIGFLNLPKLKVITVARYQELELQLLCHL